MGAVDAAGNSTPRISTHLLVDTQNPIPHIAVDSVTQDNVLNAIESGQSIPITGTVTGDYHSGDTVSLKINGANIPSLTGTVDATGHFSIPVAGNVLERANIHTSYASGQVAPIHSIEATIQTTDAVGNTGSATTGFLPLPTCRDSMTTVPERLRPVAVFSPQLAEFSNLIWLCLFIFHYLPRILNV